MFDPFRADLLKGKTTIITGGGTGLGRSMALRLAGLGARVAVLGRRGSDIREIALAYEARTGHRPQVFSGSSPGSAAFGTLRLGPA